MKANLPDPIDAHRLAEFLTPVSEFLKNYHAYRIYGLERIPPRGPALVVFNHSFASYDMFMFAAAVYSSLGRRVRPLGDRLIFKTPLPRTSLTVSGSSKALWMMVLSYSETMAN